MERILRQLPDLDISPAHLGSNAVLVFSHAMLLQSDEAGLILIVFHVRGFDAIDPSLDTVPLALNPETIPFSLSCLY